MTDSFLTFQTFIDVEISKEFAERLKRFQVAFLPRLRNMYSVLRYSKMKLFAESASGNESFLRPGISDPRMFVKTAADLGSVGEL